MKYINHIVLKMHSIVTYALFFYYTHLCKGQDASWVDPHDMNVGIHMFPPNNDYYKEQCDCSGKPTPNHSFPHYKRLISLLLASVTSEYDGQYNGILKLSISQEEYNYLKKLVKSPEEDPETFRRVDGILSHVLTKPRHEVLVDIFVSWTDSIYMTFFNRSTGILLVCMLVLYCSYKLMRANFTPWMITKWLIFLCWVVDFGVTWMHLIQEEEINKLADSLKYSSMPINCDPRKMSWIRFAWSRITFEEECREYHKNLYQSPLLKVSPLTVLSHQFGVLIKTPALTVGKAVGEFTYGIWTSLPFGANIYLLPILLMFGTIIVCIVLSFCFGSTFEFNFFHLINFNLGGRQQRRIADGNQQNLSMLNDTHRNAVEDVPEETATEEVVCSSSVTNSNSKGPDRNIGTEDKGVAIERGEDVMLKIEEKGTSEIKEPSETVKNDGSGDATNCD